MVKEINTEDFKKEIFDYTVNKEWKFQGELPTIIDFYAPWCGPCKQVGPILDELSNDFDGKINIVKLNVDENPEVAGAFGVQSIPSVLFIPMADKPQMSVGALPKEGFVQGINTVLLKDLKPADDVADETPDEKSE